MFHAALLVALLAGFVLPAARGAEAEPVQAVWKETEVDFTYMGQTTFYSCDSLERKITRILKEIGAREDVRVRAFGCTSWFSPERFMTVRINVAIPSPAVPGAGVDPQERSRRELVQRVRGESPADDEAGQFSAAWKRVTLSRKSRYLEEGDCELVEQLESRVLKKLDIRTVRADNRCIPGQIRFGQLDLEVEALMALPNPDTIPDTIPGAGP